MSQLPSRISRYEIKTIIGAGGMGSLYLARDTNPTTNRLVAIKLLNATLDSHEMRERFAREARALAALNHPNIVGIYDSGEFKGSPFIVMEYVRGETLAEKIRRKAPMPLGQKLKLMAELCSGLAHAHEAGIIHRDIKPANLMVDQQGRLKILDFGIARVAEGTRIATQMTQVNVRIGTPGYMSPEQIEGGEIDRRSDIFAAGAVCYALLAYREAFTGGNTRQIEKKVLESAPPPLSSLVPDLDPAIEEIVVKALAKDPEDRFQDALAFEEALERERWLLGPVDTPAPAGRPTPSPAREAGTPPHGSRADAAYHRSLAVYEQGAVDAARRLAIEALVEDPDHQDARKFIESLGADAWPPPPPPSALRTAEPTLLAESTDVTETVEPAAETVLSTAPAPAAGRRARGTPRRVRLPRGTAWLVAGVAAGVLVVLALAVFLVASLWPRGPLLTITRPAGGTVWTTGILCGSKASDCTANMPEDEIVELRQEADPGYVFAGFGGDCAGGRVHMTQARTCTATFAALPKEVVKVRLRLTVVKPANGWVLSSPGGITCGINFSACSADFDEGEQVKLTAYADQNFGFRGFTGDCGADGTTLMTAARSCGATFVPEQKIVRGPANPIAPGGGPTRPGRGPGGGPGGGTQPSFTPPPLPGGNTVDPLAPKPTPTAPPKPYEPPLSREELAKKDILRLLEEYRDAFEKMDLDRIRRVWPNAPLKELAANFRTYNSQKYEFEAPPEISEVDPNRGVARAKAKFRVSPDYKGSKSSPFRTEEEFILQLRDNIWYIANKKVNPVK